MMEDLVLCVTAVSSLFTPLKLLDAHEVTALMSDPTAPWSFPLAHIWMLPKRSQVNNDNFIPNEIEIRAA